MSMLIHAAPRMLKMNKTVGEVICTVRRGIVAGCKRSQQMAKAYTNRHVDRLRRSFVVSLPIHVPKGCSAKQEANIRMAHKFKGGMRVFQHVDDLTQVMWAKSEKELASKAFDSVKMWAIAVREHLHMKCSDKNVIIPEGIPARAAQRALLDEGVLVSIEAHGVDVGTDVTAGQKRNAQKLKERSNAAGKRARRIDKLTKLEKRACVLGKTGVAPAQDYGASAVGADEKGHQETQAEHGHRLGERNEERSVSHHGHPVDVGDRRAAGRQSTHGPHRSVAEVL